MADALFQNQDTWANNGDIEGTLSKALAAIDLAAIKNLVASPASLDAAIDAANKDAGDEAIIQLGEKEFAVVDIKAGTTAEALFDPDSGVSFPSLITRHTKEVEVVPLRPAQAGDDPYQRTLPERVAINTVIQGSAADLIKRAMIQVQRRLEKEQLQSRLLLQIHDELLLEVHPSETDVVQQLVVHALLDELREVARVALAELGRANFLAQDLLGHLLHLCDALTHVSEVLERDDFDRPIHDLGAVESGTSDGFLHLLEDLAAL